MQVPENVFSFLDRNNVEYDLDEKPWNLNPGSVPADTVYVRAVPFNQDGQMIQILVAADRLIDPSKFSRQFELFLEPVEYNELKPLLTRDNIIRIPAIPHWHGMTTYLDDLLLEYEYFILDTGVQAKTLTIGREAFLNITKDVHTGRFSPETRPISDNSDEDETLFTRAINTFTEKRIKQRLADTLDLPPLPDTAQRIIELRASPNGDINDLTQIVELDPSLAAQVVSWAASPYYSAPGTIKSVHDAIVRVLGFDMVLNLSLGLSLGRAVSANIMNKNQINAYWRQSVYMAATMEALVTSIDRDYRPSFGISYLAGLLSNFGHLILAEVFPPHFQTMQRLCDSNPHLPSSSVERYALGLGSHQMTAWLMQNWNMPEAVTVAIRQQHNPFFEGEHHTVAKLLYLSNQLLAERGIGRQLPAPIPNHLYQSLRLDWSGTHIVIDNLFKAGNDLDDIAEKMRI